MWFEIGRSRTFFLLLALMHLLAAASVCLTSLPTWARIATVLAILSSLLHFHYSEAKRRWRGCSLEQRRLRIQFSDGQARDAEVMPCTLVTPCCVVVCAKFEGCRIATCQVIFPDAMRADAFRELRVRLRYT